jgi:predicted nucleic acid-binding Zn ribbon protein
MKLLQCVKCGKFSPSRFENCPHCDSILEKNQNKHGQIALILFWGFNIVMAIWHIFHWVVTNSVLEDVTDTSRAGHIVTSAMLGSGEIVVYWLIGFFILGIWVLMTRE